MPTIAQPARIGQMDWRPTGRGQETMIVISGLLSVSIMITPKGYTIEGSHGRRLEGPAASIGSAKTEALKALQRILNSGVIDIEAALRVG